MPFRLGSSARALGGPLRSGGGLTVVRVSLMSGLALGPASKLPGLPEAGGRGHRTPAAGGPALQPSEKRGTPLRPRDSRGKTPLQGHPPANSVAPARKAHCYTKNFPARIFRRLSSWGSPYSWQFHPSPKNLAAGGPGKKIMRAPGGKWAVSRHAREAPTPGRQHRRGRGRRRRSVLEGVRRQLRRLHLRQEQVVETGSKRSSRSVSVNKHPCVSLIALKP